MCSFSLAALKSIVSWISFCRVPKIGTFSLYEYFFGFFFMFGFFFVCGFFFLAFIAAEIRNLLYSRLIYNVLCPFYKTVF